MGPLSPADLSTGERVVIAKAREAYPDDFDRMLIARFAQGETSASAEIAVALDLLDRELRLDRKGPIGRARGRRP